MRIWDDIAGLPTWAIMIGWVLLMLTPLTATDIETATLTHDYGYITVGPLAWQSLAFGLIPLWYFAVYQSASNRSRRTHLRDAVFVGCAIGYLVFVIAGAALYERAAEPPQALLIAVNVAWFVWALGWLGGIAVAAVALNDVDRKPEGGAYSNFGTFILMIYQPIGIWFLQPRIKRMITTPRRSEATP